MAWLFDRLPEDPIITLSIAAAIFNTLVTLIFINWAIKKKNNSVKVESSAKKSTYVSGARTNGSEQDHSEKEIANLVNLIKKLTTQLGKDNKEKQANIPNKRRENNFSKGFEAEMRNIQLQAESLLDITAPEDLLLSEAIEVLKKYDKKE